MNNLVKGKYLKYAFWGIFLLITFLVIGVFAYNSLDEEEQNDRKDREEVLIDRENDKKKEESSRDDPFAPNIFTYPYDLEFDIDNTDLPEVTIDYKDINASYHISWLVKEEGQNEFEIIRPYESSCNAPDSLTALPKIEGSGSLTLAMPKEFVNCIDGETVSSTAPKGEYLVVFNVNEIDYLVNFSNEIVEEEKQPRAFEDLSQNHTGDGFSDEVKKFHQIGQDVQSQYPELTYIETPTGFRLRHEIITDKVYNCDMIIDSNPAFIDFEFKFEIQNYKNSYEILQEDVDEPLSGVYEIEEQFGLDYYKSYEGGVEACGYHYYIYPETIDEGLTYILRDRLVQPFSGNVNDSRREKALSLPNIITPEKNEEITNLLMQRITEEIQNQGR